MLRYILTVLLVGALTSSASAADLAEGAKREAEKSVAEQPTTSHSGTFLEMVVGSTIMVGGFLVFMYGFGNPTAPPPDPNQPGIFPHRPGVGLAGIGIAAAGGALAWHGWHRAGSSSIQVGPHGFTVQHRISF